MQPCSTATITRSAIGVLRFYEVISKFSVELSGQLESNRRAKESPSLVVSRSCSDSNSEQARQLVEKEADTFSDEAGTYLWKL